MQKRTLKLVMKMSDFSNLPDEQKDVEFELLTDELYNCRRLYTSLVMDNVLLVMDNVLFRDVVKELGDNMIDYYEECYCSQCIAWRKVEKLLEDSS